MKKIFFLFKCGSKSVKSSQEGRVLGTGKRAFLPYLSTGLKKLQSIQNNTPLFQEGFGYQGF